MANKNVERFIEIYTPVAQQVSKEIGVDPNVLLSQWGSESRWGQSEMAKKYHNLAGIKDVTGGGFKAKDNQTGSVDKYAQFEDPEVFGMYYADMIRNNFPNAVGAGSDIGYFTRGLASGKKGAYFEVSPEQYQTSLNNAFSAIPQEKMVEFNPAPQDDELVPADVPPAPPPSEEPDTSGAPPSERALMGIMGGGAGIAASGLKGMSEMGIDRSARRAGAEEAARIQARRALGEVGAAPPTMQSVFGKQQRQIIPSGGPDAGMLAEGTTRNNPHNYAKSLGLTDIEAGQALDMTKNEGGAHDLSTQRREGINKVKEMFPTERYQENTRFGGLMTPDQSVGGGPRQSFVMEGNAPARPLPPRAPIPQAMPPIPASSGLDAVTDLFKGMMKPVTAAVKVANKYLMPPLAGVSAGLDAAELMNEYRKPQPDYTKMGIKGAGLAGGVLSMFPPSQGVGVPLMLGAGAVDYARDNPDLIKNEIRRRSSMYADPNQVPDYRFSAP